MWSGGEQAELEPASVLVSVPHCVSAADLMFFYFLSQFQAQSPVESGTEQYLDLRSTSVKELQWKVEGGVCVCATLRLQSVKINKPCAIVLEPFHRLSSFSHFLK